MPRIKTGAIACGAAALLGGLLYLNALHNPFVYDDYQVVVDNPSIRHLSNLRAILLYRITRPVVNLSYAIDRALWGADPFGYHVTNVLLHMLNIVLLFQLVRRLADDRQSVETRAISSQTVAFGAAILFAVHPMMTEAVGYISGRFEVLCATWFLLDVMFARRWMKEGGAKWWLLTIGFWIAMLATKEIGVMFPFVVFLYGRLVLGGTWEEKRRRRLRLHGPLIAFALIAAIARLVVFERVEHPGAAAFHWKYILVELDVMRRYLTLFLMPSGQAIFHEVAPIRSVLELRAILAVAVVGLLGGFAWRVRRIDPVVTLGIFWFLLLMVPSSALVVLDQGEPMAEHRVYVAACGLFMAAGAGVGWVASLLASRRSRVLARALVAVGLFSLCGATLVRNAVWASPVTLWLEAVEMAPRHWRARLMLGEALQDAGRCDQAVGIYKAAISLRPQEQFGYMKLGLCLAQMGKLDEAADAFAHLRRIDPHSPVASIGLGAVAMMAGQADRARRYFLETIEEDPRNVAARQSLAMLEETVAANPAAALQRCEEIHQIAPETPGNDDCIRRNRSRVAAGGR